VETSEKKRESGFTLIELLIAIVVVGILTAVAIVGIAGLTNKGSNSACTATSDAAKAAIAVHFANTGQYPQDWHDLTAATAPAQPELELAGGVTPNPPVAGNMTLTGKGWTLDMIPGATVNDPTTLSTCP
jgi:prepilin-type N-terminal cleavage/methylation domain-containing protein